MNIGYIYKITNEINNKCYIGQTTGSVERRWNEHKNISKNENSSSYNYPLYCSFRKYGIENFKFEILEECNIKKLNEREIYWIEYYNSTNNKLGYNQSLGGEGRKTLKLDEELIVKKYNEIGKIYKVSELFNCSFDTIYEVLLKNKITIKTAQEHAKDKGYQTICENNGEIVAIFNCINEAADWLIANNISKTKKNIAQNIRNAIIYEYSVYGYRWKSEEYNDEFKSYYKDKVKNRVKNYRNKTKDKVKNRLKTMCPECGKKMEVYSSHCRKCENLKRKELSIIEKEENRGVTRDILKQEIRITSFTELGKKYGVSDNAIKKWCKTYNLPHKKSDINNYSDEEWENL